LLSQSRPARVITPTHPGFGGTPRPEALNTLAAVAKAYAELLVQLDLSDVTLVGNSIGGWIAAELALLAGNRVSSLVLVDAVGIVVDGHPVTDITDLSLDQVMTLSYHDPSGFRIDPNQLSDAQRAGMAANRAALSVYAGEPYGADPTLRARLAGITQPALVVWGEADQIVDPDYGRAYAAAIPGAQFELLPETGHVPQIETPELLLAPVWAFANRHQAAPAGN
jgi:pimeloyl-ACP methyl ester carboxylesterase